MTRADRRGYRRQQGVAIITALLLTTLAVTIVASLFWQQQVQVRSIENQRLQLQKQWVLRGALDWAMLILREDARHSTLDTLDEPWAVELAETRLDQYVEDAGTATDASDAVLSGHVIDAQSRFNLTNLATAGVVDPAQVAVFQRLLAQLQLGADSNLAEATAQTLAAGQTVSAVAGGARNGRAPAAAAVSTARTIGITQVDDLLAVPGMSIDAYLKMRDFVTVLPRSTPININTAPAEVLAAIIDTLSAPAAAALVAGRERASFRSNADLRAQLPGMAIDDSRVAVGTSFFLVQGTVRIGRAALQMLALIERNGTTTRTVWVRES